MEVTCKIPSHVTCGIYKEPKEVEPFKLSDSMQSVIVRNISIGADAKTLKDLSEAYKLICEAEKAAAESNRTNKDKAKEGLTKALTVVAAGGALSLIESADPLTGFLKTAATDLMHNLSK